MSSGRCPECGELIRWLDDEWAECWGCGWSELGDEEEESRP